MLPFDPGSHLARLDSPGPEIAVIIAVVRDGKLLLTRREDFDVWCLPGGSLVPGESLAQAARREAAEETGLQVTLTRLVGVYTRLSQNSLGIYLVVFAARPTGGRLQPQPGEVQEAGEFNAHDLPDEMFLAHREMALDALAGVGGSYAWTQNVPWPFPPEMNRREIYTTRDSSGLSHSEFYRKHFPPVRPEDETDELGRY
jgi:8-oxo-dGTP pyrophosphatase MutT (NUDIX family)